MSTRQPNAPQGNWRVAVVLGLAGAALIWLILPQRALLTTPLTLLATGQLMEFQIYLRSLGSWGYLTSVMLLIAGAVGLPLPAMIVMVADGLVYGTWLGMAVSFTGSLLGAAAAFAIGAHVGRRQRDGRCHAAVSNDPVIRLYTPWAIVLGRWVPGIPGDPMSYAAGFTGMSVHWFLLLTVLALVPATFVTAFVGTEVTTDVTTPYWIFGLAMIALACWAGARGLNRVRRTPRLLTQ
jgi:uncharacterized membrane protein YdjX (TVP38/TMEM64 family)